MTWCWSSTTCVGLWIPLGREEQRCVFVRFGAYVVKEWGGGVRSEEREELDEQGRCTVYVTGVI